MGKPEKMFSPSLDGISAALRQGEIISNLVQIRIDLDSISTSHVDEYVSYSGTPIVHPFAIVVSQDCDLNQDYFFRFHKRGKERHALPSIVFCEVTEAEELVYGDRNATVFQEGAIRQDFRNNNDFRFHFIQAIPKSLDKAGDGLPELGIEFKRYFTLPSDEVYLRIELKQAQRHCHLLSPYRDHFINRFYGYNNRVALPEQYESI